MPALTYHSVIAFIVVGKNVKNTKFALGKGPIQNSGSRYLNTLILTPGWFAHQSCSGSGPHLSFVPPLTPILKTKSLVARS